MSNWVDAASAAASAGRWQDAERLWSQVRAADPRHVQALYSLGVHAFQRRDTANAIDLLQQARACAPADPMIPLTLSVVFRDTGDPAREWAAIGEALTIEPYFLPGLLSKAEFLERSRGRRVAAPAFRNALKVAPAESAHWPAALRRRLEHALNVVRDDADECAAFLQQQLAADRSASAAALDTRWVEAASILAGKSRPYPSQCNDLHVPRLAALPFYPRELFPWIAALESKTERIRGELLQLLESHPQMFRPYIQYRPGDPVNQWKTLNHSLQWSAFHLWEHGKPVAEHIALCPETTQALAAIDAVEIDGICPNAMFSALAPGTTIPPHTGETNARLVGHLPLVTPERCALRVGHDWRTWTAGDVMVFDDTIEHEARNDSDQLRVVLIFDVWNPLLSQDDRHCVTTLARAIRRFRQPEGA